MSDTVSKIIQMNNQTLPFTICCVFSICAAIHNGFVSAFRASAAVPKPVRHSKMLPGCSLPFFILLCLFVACLRKSAWLLRSPRVLECLNMLWLVGHLYRTSCTLFEHIHFVAFQGGWIIFLHTSPLGRVAFENRPIRSTRWSIMILFIIMSWLGLELISGIMWFIYGGFISIWRGSTDDMNISRIASMFV